MAQQILVIDDDPFIGELIERTLEEYSVTVAGTGEEGLEHFAAKSYDLVLCDLLLPGIGGLEVIQKIRAQRPRARVMVVSAHGTPEHFLATLRESVVDFLVKPFSAEALRTAVANLLACEQAIQVLSATPKWIQLRLPASFQVAARLEEFFANLTADIDEATRRSVSVAFRELLNNSIEHGCAGDEKRMIGLSYVRLERAILYRIQDPGGGFDFADLAHAAVANPPDDPVRHLDVRQQKGLRPGGFGLLWIQSLADELIFNETRNEVLLVKYLNGPVRSSGP